MPTIRINKQILDLSTPRIMGILNVTPDSFYDGGRHTTPDQLIDRVQAMRTAGMDILDIGGASSRPGAAPISAQAEMDRVIPVIEKISSTYPDQLISVDTYHAEVAQQAIQHGAHLINDITAGEGDPLMISTVASLDVPYAIMHMQGEPSTMQQSPQYTDVVMEVGKYLSARVEECIAAGIKDVIIDPGFGFGKSVDHNYRLLDALGHFQFMNRPILVGLSRKSMIQKVLDITADEALNGTTALNMTALLKGASILRVHDVQEAAQCVRLLTRLRESHG